MRKFLLGFVVGIIVVLLAGFCYVRLGFIDRAPTSRWVALNAIWRCLPWMPPSIVEHPISRIQ